MVLVPAIHLRSRVEEPNRSAVHDFAHTSVLKEIEVSLKRWNESGGREDDDV